MYTVLLQKNKRKHKFISTLPQGHRRFAARGAGIPAAGPQGGAEQLRGIHPPYGRGERRPN